MAPTDAGSEMDPLLGAVREVSCSSCGWPTAADDDSWVRTADGRALCELCSHEAAADGSGDMGGEGIIVHCPSCGQIQDRAMLAERVHVAGVGDVCRACAERRLRTQRCLECARDVRESDCRCFFHEAWWCNECLRSNVVECASCRRTAPLNDSIYGSWRHRTPVTTSSFGKHGAIYCPECARSSTANEDLAAFCSICGDPHDPETSVCGSACNHCTNHGVF
jgi:hypothetical protein